MKNKLEIVPKGLTGLTFKIGDQERTLDYRKSCDLHRTISDYLRWYEHWEYSVRWYDGYSLEKIEEILKDQEQDWEGESYDSYGVGGEYASYLSVDSNNKAADILKKEYTKEFGENTLEFDPESSYCYVYSKNLEEAKQFKWWVYTKYIKHVLDDIKKQ